MNRRELTEKRSANTKFFENQDHSITAEIYLDKVHYQDTDGSWKEMDDTLMEEEAAEDAAEIQSQTEGAAGKTEKDLVNHKGSLSIRFKKQSNPQGTITMEKDGAGLTWGLEGCNKVKNEQTEGTVSYAGILDDVDLRCMVRGERVKEDLILKGRKAPESFTYLYKLKKLTPSLAGNRVSFLDEQGEEAFSVSAPYMKDAAGEQSEAIRLTLEEDKKKQVKVTFTPDPEWLAAPERQYPVVLDPVTTTSKKAADIEDTYVSSKNEEDNFYDNIYLRIQGGDEIYRSFLKFELPEIKTGDMIVGARLVLVSLAENGAERTIQVHKVLQSWEADTINWYNNNCK